jgi:ribosomal-protein-alanine N-acetyltransferase
MVENRPAADPGSASDAPFAPVTTPRLLLRCPTEADAPALAALMTGRTSQRLASWPHPFTPALARDRIRGVRDAAQAGRSVPLVMQRRSDDALVGWFAASLAAENDAVALLTYWLGEEFHGAGLMREAAPACLRLALRVLPVGRVRAAVQADNAASLAVVRILGMRPLGPGRIWCPARNQEEDCLWFDLARDAAGA